jgi:hypothetical protein
MWVKQMSEAERGGGKRKAKLCGLGQLATVPDYVMWLDSRNVTPW